MRKFTLWAVCFILIISLLMLVGCNREKNKHKADKKDNAEISTFSDETETFSEKTKTVSDNKTSFPEETKAFSDKKTTFFEETATFLGVKNSIKATRDTVLSSSKCVYQFKTADGIKSYSVLCSKDNYALQNRLMIGYDYKIKVEGNKVISAEIVDKSQIKGVVKGYTPGKRTLKNFLKTAIAPMGKTIYVYGGGWNFEDSGSSFMSRTIGLSPTWERFYNGLNADYSYEKDTYPVNGWNTYYYAGLDCSGYLGWVLYNTVYDKTEAYDGFVCSSTKMANSLAENYHYGTFEHINCDNPTTNDFKAISNKLHPGDIISINGHTYIILGRCKDQSVLILNSTVSKSSTGVEGGGVQINALSVNGNNDTSCDAFKLANEYMNKYFSEWTKKYPVVLKPITVYFCFPSNKKTTGIFSWYTDENGLTDTENVKNMSAEQVLQMLFDE